MSRAFLLVSVLLCGCFGNSTGQPSPEPDQGDQQASVVDAAAVREAYQNVPLLQAKVQREAAAKIRAGEITSAAEESAFLDPRMMKARQSAMHPIPVMEQAVLGADEEGRMRWNPATAAVFRDALADAMEARQ
jgi:hypothetical protein